MSLGFEQAGFDVIAAIDFDPVHLAVHHYNFPRAEPLCRDVHELTSDEVVRAAERGWRRSNPTGQSWNGRIDCVTGGPSCQGFSVIGRRDPLDARNELVFAFARIVRELTPRYFVLENVPGLLGPAYQPLMGRLIAELEAAGYDVGEGPFVLNSSSYGVPQDRRRVFLVGAFEGEERPGKSPPQPASITAHAALNDLIDSDSFEELLEADEVELPAADLRRLEALSSSYVRRLRGGQSVDGADLSQPRVWNRGRLTASKRTVHTADVVKRFRSLSPGARDPIARLSRLKADKPSPTLRAGTGRDHGSFTSARPIHYEHPRVITVREAARLHSFPDWFRFHVTKWHGFRQVGNAVPPLLARAVAAQIAIAATDRSLERRTDPLELGDPSLLSLSPAHAAEVFGIDPSSLPPDVRRRHPVDTGPVMP